MTTESQEAALDPRGSVVAFTGSARDQVKAAQETGLLRMVSDLKDALEISREKVQRLEAAAANYKNSWEQARERVKLLEGEPAKLRQNIESLRGELRAAGERGKEMAKSLSEAGDENLRLRRQAAQADSRFSAFQPTAEKMQRARDAALEARDAAAATADRLRDDLAQLRKKQTDSQSLADGYRVLLVEIRKAMPADLAQVKNERFRELLGSMDQMGFKPAAGPKAKA